MAFTWGTRRKLLYSSAVTVVCAFLVLAGWKILFTAVPMCNDGKQNGTERGVDCGGSCSLVCVDDARAPVVLWARAFRNGEKSYTAAAYVQNNNQGAGARNVQYSFQLLDDQNILVVEYDGVLNIPPVKIIPVIVPNIDVGNRTVVRTLFAFSDVPTWYKVSADQFPALRVTGQDLNSDGSRLTATVVNDSNSSVKKLTVTAVLFDQGGVARAASQSSIAELAKKSSQQIIFTWPQGTPNIVRAEVTVLPSL